MWLAIKGRLSTLDRLQKWGNCIVNRCYLCMKEAEDLEHIFFKCDFSREVWEKVRIKAKIHNCDVSWNNIVQELANANNGNNIGSVVRRLCFAACVYSIWHERNCRVFRGENREVIDVVKAIIDTVKMKLMCINVKSSEAFRVVEKDWAIVCKNLSNKM